MEWEKLLNYRRRRESSVDPNRLKISGDTDSRNSFESDFGRVVFSSSCRRLHDKTQVFPLTSDDNIHSRLTHSMEVMNIGLSFAIYLCGNDEFKAKTELSEIDILRKISPILKTSCLVHDIGNPPFGHFGEVVIQEYFKDLFANLEGLCKGDKNSSEISRFIYNSLNDSQRAELNDLLKNDCLKYDYTQFDGNAEGFRVLTKLQYLGDLFGLNLTYATLAATLKYPNLGAKDKGGYIGVHKHGVFYTEKEALDEIITECKLISDNGSICRHPLAFLMEAADSICYYIMDVEDAIQKQWIKYEDLEKGIQKLDNEDLYNRFFSKKDNIKYTKKKWVDLRTKLITYLMELATKEFINNLDSIIKGTYDNELIENDAVTQLLKGLSRDKILSNRDIMSLEVTGEAVISGILNAYIKYFFHKEKSFRTRGKALISKSIFMTVLHEYVEKHQEDDNLKDDYRKHVSIEGRCDTIEELYDKFDVGDFSVEERFRVIRDFIACMTDKFALNHLRKLNGQKI
ncbi:dGTP triphosphohydrolase [Phocaeicola coprocola]|jgi:dGTPase|uniref:dGTP triphosphohydrolase n=1 Tax=Phocaeicola coprocola TaxID=310298 RepID=UPI0022DFA9A0|nr:dNTP triphosphohydrolase [Phocaeicola coprocola]